MGRGRNLLHEMGGNVTDASGPSRRRAPGRAFGQLPACIPSRWDKTGRRKAEAEKSSTCKSAAWRLRTARRLPQALPVAGLRPTAAATRIACNQVCDRVACGRLWTLLALFDHLSQRLLDRREAGVERRAARVEHQVPLRRNLGVMQPECFPQAALDAVPHHCLSDRAGHREPQAGATRTDCTSAASRTRASGTRRAF
jgi:hypothetical protein